MADGLTVASEWASLVAANPEGHNIQYILHVTKG
jgi:hypothetical protein